MTVANLSKGPVLVERAVHIIFVPDGVAGVSETSDVLPTDAQLAEAATFDHIGSPAPTDVIVFARRPWHYVDGKLRKHPEVHHDYPDTVLELDVARGEKVLWWSERVFTITNIAACCVFTASSHLPFAASANANVSPSGARSLC